MTEIIRELTVIKKTNVITSKQVLAWARRVESQIVQKAIIEANKENNSFDAMKEETR